LSQHKKEEENVGQSRRDRGLPINAMNKKMPMKKSKRTAKPEIKKKFANQAEEQQRSIDESNRGPPIEETNNKKQLRRARGPLIKARNKKGDDQSS